MKLTYSNWHKELVHDDAIRSELDSITGGELEFSNTPYIKHRNAPIETDAYGTGRNNRGRQNFGGRNDRSRGSQGGGRDSRGGNGQGRSDNRNNNRGGQGGGGGRDNRSGGSSGPNRNFKKRF